MALVGGKIQIRTIYHLRFKTKSSQKISIFGGDIEIDNRNNIMKLTNEKTGGKKDVLRKLWKSDI